MPCRTSAGPRQEHPAKPMTHSPVDVQRALCLATLAGSGVMTQDLLTYRPSFVHYHRKWTGASSLTTPTSLWAIFSAWMQRRVLNSRKKILAGDPTVLRQKDLAAADIFPWKPAEDLPYDKFKTTEAWQLNRDTRRGQSFSFPFRPSGTSSAALRPHDAFMSSFRCLQERTVT